MDKVNIISSGSQGNAVLYHQSILVDCGVSFSKLEPFVKDIKIILLTHIHGDHINLKALKKLQYERPALRIGCCKWLVPTLSELNNIDVYQIGKIYNYGSFKVSPFKLYHDVENCGYRIFKEDYKIFHATDTAHLEGITAKGYDLYAVEHNYDEEKVIRAIEEARQQGKYCHAQGSIKTHLSYEQAWAFIQANKKENSEVIQLHKSQSFY